MTKNKNAEMQTGFFMWEMFHETTTYNTERKQETFKSMSWLIKFSCEDSIVLKILSYKEPDKDN